MRKKRAIINIISTLMLQVITVICGFIVPRLILENFGSSTNGLISSITQFLSYISLIDGGFGVVIKAALYKPIAENDDENVAKVLKTSENIFKKIAYIFIVYIVILIFVFPIINNEFSFGYTASLVIILSLGTFIEYYFGITYKIYLQAKQQLYITSFTQIILYILNTLAVLVLVNIGANIQIVKLVSSLIFVIRPIVQLLYVKRKYHITINQYKPDNSLISQRWSGMIQHIASVIHTNTDIAILTVFSTLSEVSVYSVYLAVMNGIKNVISSISNGIEASFGDMIAKKEKETLNKSFRLYEFIQYNIITIVFTTAVILILPFIKIYTRGINDTNYQRPLFAYLFILTEGIYCIRLMYNSIALSAGRFKEIQKGSLVEAFMNIMISLILVKKLGIIGIIIGTLISILIRCIELMMYVSKNILERKMSLIFKNIIVLTIASVFSIIFNNLFINMDVSTYMTLIIYAIIVFLVTTIITAVTNLIFNFQECKIFIKRVKEIAMKKIKIRKE